MFSSTAIALTLEQKIDAKAVSQCLGILYITNNISARQSWAKESYYLCTSIYTVGIFGDDKERCFTTHKAK